MSFTVERPVKATRKPHRCDACLRMISPGEAAINCAGIYEGEFASGYFHPECREAEIGLNKLQGTRWQDDWTALHDADREDYRWLKAEHPIAYRRMHSPIATLTDTQP